MNWYETREETSINIGESTHEIEYCSNTYSKVIYYDIRFHWLTYGKLLQIVCTVCIFIKLCVYSFSLKLEEYKYFSKRNFFFFVDLGSEISFL